MPCYHSTTVLVKLLGKAITAGRVGKLIQHIATYQHVS